MNMGMDANLHNLSSEMLSNIRMIRSELQELEQKIDSLEKRVEALE